MHIRELLSQSDKDIKPKGKKAQLMDRLKNRYRTWGIDMSCYLPEKEFEELKPTVSKKESVQSVTNCHHVKQIVGTRLHPKTLIPEYKSKDPVLNDLIGKLKANLKLI